MILAIAHEHTSTWILEHNFMLYAKGSRVRFIHTGAEGVVEELLDEGMISVLLDDGDVIPAFLEDLIRVEDYRAALSKKPPVKAKIIKGKEPKKNQPPDRPQAEMQYLILKSKGIQLAFDPVLKTDGTTEKYLIYLINDTKYDVLFTFELSLKNTKRPKVNGKMNSISVQQVAELFFDQLNEAPNITIECRQLTTEGSGPPLQKTIRIKPKQFFSKLTTAPILNKRVHHYLVFENFDPEEKKGEDLKSYTQRKKPKPATRSGNFIQFPTHDIEELAAFIPEIDLHIENLSRNHRKMSNAEILYLQLKHFEEFLTKAIRLGVPRVFIIHGVGKGRLKHEISKRLQQQSYVVSFKNEYHAKYGYGATEVIFQK